jgi:hypothetical protein
VNRVRYVNERYEKFSQLLDNGVRIERVADPNGARFDSALRNVIASIGQDSSGAFEQLLGAAKALRWNLITQPQGLDYNATLIGLVDSVVQLASNLRGSVNDEGIFEELGKASTNLLSQDPILGAHLLQTCSGLSPELLAVIAASAAATNGLSPWLEVLNIRCYTERRLEHERPECEQLMVVGPPRFFSTSLVWAPLAPRISFIVPSWFGDLRLPEPAITKYCEKAIKINVQIEFEDDTQPAVSTVEIDQLSEDELLPTPFWGVTSPTEREPGSDEVVAHKLLLGGNLAMWLDDGDRIRSLDPSQPKGERVTYTDVAAVREGTYLLLRQGETERGALYEAALGKLGARGEDVRESQSRWKQRLASRIRDHGYRRVVKEVKTQGVSAADRVRAWTDPNLIRPARDQDFELLLNWLEVPIQPTFGYAALLRKTLYLVSADVGRKLEAAVSDADLSILESNGYLSLDIEEEGFRGIIATRVRAISPFAEIVSRHDARVAFEDQGALWLE